MQKSSQVLVIDPPAEITFKGPFTDVVTSHIKLTNPTEKQVCFKVKTTAPKQYCVRPNSGLIPPSDSVLVSVMLQPFDYNAEERNKHKFMVQSAFVPSDEHSLENIWKNTPANEIMDSKLRVVFDVPDQAAEKHVVSKAQPVQQQQAADAKSHLGQSTEADYRRVVEEAKRYLHQLTQLEQENKQLRDRLSSLESSGAGDAYGEAMARNANVAPTLQQGSAGGAVALQQRSGLQLLLMLFAALVVGFVLSKIL